MKKTMTTAVLGIALSLAASAQQPQEAAIKKTIIEFAQAADNNDASALATHLDDNYQVIMNRLFGSTEVSVMPRAVYLEKTCLPAGRSAPVNSEETNA